MPDTITAVLSGPAGSVGPARRALEAAGCHVRPGDHSHGHASEDRAHTFVTAVAGHPDEAVTAVTGLGWRLRGHWPTPPAVIAEVDPVEALRAELQARGVL